MALVLARHRTQSDKKRTHNNKGISAIQYDTSAFKQTDTICTSPAFLNRSRAAYLHFVFSIFGSDNLNVIGRIIIGVLSLVLGLSILYFSAHLYNVSFDRDFIYLSRLGKKEKISIEKIEEIKPGFIPFRLFYSNAYIMTVIYFDNQKKYKVHFLSKGATGIVGTVDHIPLLDTVRQFIKDRKYSR